jgi:hypothetical protein
MHKAQILEDLKLAKQNSTSLKDAIVRVARKHRKSQSAVQNLWYHSGLQFLYPNTHRLFNSTQERVAIGILNACALASLPLSPQDARETLSEVFGIRVAKTTFHDWLKRKNLGFIVTHAKSISKKRIDAAKVDELNRYCNRLEKEMERVPYNKESVFNVDETTVEFRGNKLSGIFKACIPKKNRLSTQRGRRLSLMTFVRATGDRFLSVFLLQSERGQQEGWFEPDREDRKIPSTLPGQGPILYYRSATGKLTQDSFEAVMDRFAMFCRVQAIDYPLYVFADQCSAHTNRRTILKTFEKQISICFFPSDTSHFIQPLDDVPFAVFKRKFDQIYQKYQTIAAAKSLDPSRAFAWAAIVAENQALTPKVIRKGFENTGIFPYNRARIMKNARNLGPMLEEEDDNKVIEYTMLFSNILDEKLNLTGRGVRKRKRQIRDEVAYIARDNIAAALAKNDPFAPPRKRPKYAHGPRLFEEEGDDLLVCPAEGCRARHYRGKNWKKCEACGQQFCPKHRATFEQHQADHPIDVVN